MAIVVNELNDIIVELELYPGEVDMIASPDPTWLSWEIWVDGVIKVIDSIAWLGTNVIEVSVVTTPVAAVDIELKLVDHDPNCRNLNGVVATWPQHITTVV